MLQIRRGARYSCESDGLCCSDVHALGPLTRSESVRVSSYDPESVAVHPRLGLVVLKPRADHTCRFFDFDQGCRIHRERGALAKPAACRQFPFGLVATPAGLRVTTAHRCPCRTMGDRAPLDVAEARSALTHGGRLRIDQTVRDRVRLTRRRQLGWIKYERVEALVLAGLLDGSLAATLGRTLGQSADGAAFPAIIDATWADVAHSHRAMVDGSTTGEALAWFGDALLFVLEGKRLEGRARPWAWSFERAARRVHHPRDPAALYADFAADRVYGLRWSEESSLAGELLSLSVALRCAGVIANAIARAASGASNGDSDSEARTQERAAAEAVMIAEVALAGPLSHVRFEGADEAAMLSSIGIA